MAGYLPIISTPIHYHASHVTALSEFIVWFAGTSNLYFIWMGCIFIFMEIFLSSFMCSYSSWNRIIQIIKGEMNH